MVSNGEFKGVGKDIFTPAAVRKAGQEAIVRSGLLAAGDEPTQLQALHELEPVVEAELNRHNRMRRPWVPADFFPLDEEGRIVGRLGQDETAQPLSPEAQAAMVVNLLTEDNLPAYHRIIANNFGLDGPWGTWTNQWTAEEDAHAYVMRVFLDLTKQVAPSELEADRLAQMQQGYAVEKDPFHTLAYVTFQELATRVSHRQTGLASKNDIADAMLERVAADENLHMLFYRNLAKNALDLAPNQMMRAITDEVMGFEMPGSNIKGFQVSALRIANAQIYDLRRHADEVVKPVLRQWKIFERDDFTGYGAEARDELARFLDELDKSAARFDEQRDSGRVDSLIARLAARDQRASSL